MEGWKEFFYVIRFHFFSFIYKNMNLDEQPVSSDIFLFDMDIKLIQINSEEITEMPEESLK